MNLETTVLRARLTMTWLSDEEIQLIERHRAQKARAQWGAGRWAATCCALVVCALLVMTWIQASIVNINGEDDIPAPLSWLVMLFISA
jgi:hypothetical protein